MKVKRNTLLLLACLVWSAAGFNILRIGLMAYPAYGTVFNGLLSVLVFAVFERFIFGKLVKKHTERVSAYSEERHFFLKFFDGKSFAVMAVMMTGGRTKSSFTPTNFIMKTVPAGRSGKRTAVWWIAAIVLILVMAAAVAFAVFARANPQLFG